MAPTSVWAGEYAEVWRRTHHESPEKIRCKLVQYKSDEGCIYHCTGDQGSDFYIVKEPDPITLECEDFDYSPPDH